MRLLTLEEIETKIKDQVIFTEKPDEKNSSRDIKAEVRFGIVKTIDESRLAMANVDFLSEIKDKMVRQLAVAILEHASGK